MKPTQNFRLSSTTKYLLSTITDPEARSIYRRAMIEAQLKSEEKPAAKDDKKSK